MKRILLVVFLFAVAFSLCFGGSAFAVSSFTDVPDNHWAKIAIDYGVDNEYLTGMGDNKFQPSTTTTRAQICTMIVKKFGFIAGPNVFTGGEDIVIQTFSDVKDGDWFKGYVDIASSLGIVNGYPDNTFLPNNDITREEIAVMLIKALDVYSKQKYDKFVDVSEETANENIDNFTDYEQIKASWGWVYVGGVNFYEVMGGYPDGSMKIKNFITRAEAAQVVYNTVRAVFLIDEANL